MYEILRKIGRKILLIISILLMLIGAILTFLAINDENSVFMISIPMLIYGVTLYVLLKRSSEDTTNTKTDPVEKSDNPYRDYVERKYKKKDFESINNEDQSSNTENDNSSIDETKKRRFIPNDFIGRKKIESNKIFKEGARWHTKWWIWTIIIVLIILFTPNSKAEIERLNENLASIREENNDLKLDIEELEKDNNYLKSELSKIEDSRKELNELRKEKESLEEELKILKDKSIDSEETKTEESREGSDNISNRHTKTDNNTNTQVNFQKGRFEEAYVKRVVDGDTIIVNLNGREHRVRFILVDTPETKHPTKGKEYYGKEASDYTTKHLEGKTIYLEKDVSETDRYNRLLRYIWLSPNVSNNPTEEEFRNYSFNAMLLINGYATLSTFPPDVKYVDMFRKFSREAYSAGIGLYDGGSLEEVQSFTSTKKTTSSTENASSNNEPNQSSSTSERIKGNKNSMIYHMPYQRDYDKIKESNIIYFDTEEEAQNAGFRRAKR